MRNLVAIFSAFILLAFPILAYADNTDWPTYLYNGERQSNNTNETTLSPTNTTLQKLWSFKTGGNIAASATVVNGIVYIGSWDGYEYALNSSTGTLLWKTFLGVTLDSNCNTPNLGITSAAAIENGVVYVGGGDSYWYALDAASGSILWKVYTGDNSITGGHYNWSSPLIYNGFAYIGVASTCDIPLVQGQLLQVSLVTHQIINTFNVVPTGQVGGGIWTSPSVNPLTNTIYITTGTINGNQTYSQAIIALDANTLLYKGSWQLPASASVADSDFGTSPMIFPGATSTFVSAINKNGYLYVLNADNLSNGPVWQYNIAIGGGSPQAGQGSISSGSFANNQIFYAGGQSTINGTTYLGSIRSFDTSGNLIWQYGTPQTPMDAIAMANGVIAETAGDLFYLFNASSGMPLYEVQLTNITDSAPSISNGSIYVATVDGYLTAFKVNTTSNTSFGGADINTYCQDNNIGSASVINNQWACNNQTINITKVCEWQYQDINAYAQEGTPDNPYTWECLTNSNVIPTPTPTPTTITTPTLTDTPTPSTSSGSPTPILTDTPTPTASASATPTSTPSITNVPTPDLSLTPTPISTISATPTASDAASPTSDAATPTPVDSPSPTDTLTPTSSASLTPTSNSPTPTSTPTPTLTPVPLNKPTPTDIPTPTLIQQILSANYTPESQIISTPENSLETSLPLSHSTPKTTNKTFSKSNWIMGILNWISGIVNLIGKLLRGS